LRDSGQNEAALTTYLERARLGYYHQEVFLSLLSAARLKEKLEYSSDDIISAYMEATAVCPTRAEATHGAARFCRDKGIYERGYGFAAMGLAIACPNNALFVEDWIYKYGMLDELAINAYWTARYAECVDACDRLLSQGKLPAEHHDRVLKNRQFARDKLREIYARTASADIEGEKLEMGAPNRSPEALRSQEAAVPQPGLPLVRFTKRTALPYAVRRAADYCPGISVENITRRIGYASYVNVERRYMYYQVSKAGCTSMKWLLHSLERLPPVEYFVGSQRESRRGMFIHERSNLKIPSLLDLDDATQEFVLTSPEFMRFTVVRNPYTRTESAWKDKVRLCAPTYERFYRAIKGKLPAGNDLSSLVSFREFVDAIALEDLANCDGHWRLQVMQTLGGALNFTHIGHLEDFSEIVGILQSHLSEAQPPRSVGSNRTAGASHYDEDIAKAVYELYESDFEAFGYDRESWVRPSNENKPPMVPEAIFVDEVLERNIVIDHLYEERDALKHRVQELELSLRDERQSHRIANVITAARSGPPSEGETLMALLQAAWQKGELARPSDEILAAFDKAAG
jgi:hypothetical protein